MATALGVSFGPFRLDLERRVLWRGDSVVAVAPKAVDLLVALVRRGGELATKEELLREVWPDTFVEEANLSVLVSQLRKELGGPKEAFIETVPRRGYRFSAKVTTRAPEDQASREANAGAPPNPAAHEATLRGRHFWSRLTRPALHKARRAYEEALGHDPSFAAAHAGIANTAILQALFGFEEQRSALARARGSAETAVELDRLSADALAARAYARLFRDWDFAGAERDLERAETLAPERADVQQWFALYLALVGRFDRALEKVGRAMALDPVSLTVNTSVGLHVYLTQQHDPQIEPFLRTLDLDPDFAVGYWAIGLAHDARGEHDSAVEAYERADRLAGGSPLIRSNLARGLALGGREGEARSALGALEASSISGFRLATVHLALGDTEKALASLDRSVAEGDAWAVWLKVDPMLEPLRGEPRYQALVDRVGFPA